VGVPDQLSPRRRPLPPGPCPLDASVYNLASAWWGVPNEHFLTGWRAFFHGAGTPTALEACGCPLCHERLELTGPRPAPLPPEPSPEPPRSVDVEPVRAHVRELLAAGVTRETIAVAAGIDSTTIGRLLRADVRGVLATTAAALLAVEPPARLRAVQ
jgi:hypothetical protein